MSLQRSASFASRGERHNVVKRADNLKMEGEFEGKRLDSATTSRRVSNASSVSHRSGPRDKSNILIGDDLSASTSKGSRSVTTKSKTTMSKHEQQSTQITSEASIAAKANASSAFQSALVQNGQSKGNISAINTDKFASSLRESSASASQQHQQKEISVIEHHRKQSLQKQQRSDWGAASSSSAGYELNAHTGRTAAYGGRDFEQTAALAGAGRRSDYSAKSTGYSYNAQESGSSSKMSASTSSRQASGAVISGGSFSQHGAGAIISGSSLRQHAAEAVISGGSSSRQQSSGAAMLLSTTGSARQDYQSMYQSTSQQSFKGQQSSSEYRVEHGTPVKRKTWAESSILSGGVGIQTSGSSSYAQDYHEHRCPASKVYAKESPFKYDRQNSAGHKIFKPKQGDAR